MSNDFWDISPEAAKVIQAAQNFSLNVPDNARTVGDRKHMKYWMEVVDIASVDLSFQVDDKTGDNTAIFTIGVDFTAEGMGGNSGASTRLSYWVNKDMLDRNDKDEQYSKSNQAKMARVLQILVATGLMENIAEGISSDTMKEVFSAPDGESPLIGQRVWVEIRQMPKQKLTQVDGAEKWVDDPSGKFKIEGMKWLKID